MKKSLFLFLLAGLLAACTGKKTETKQKSPDSDLVLSKEISSEVQSDSVDYQEEKSTGFLTEVDVEEYNRRRGTDEFHYKRGLVLYEIKNYLEGIKEFDTVIKISPNLGSAYVNRGKGFIQLEEYQKALADFQKAVAIDPSDSTAYLNLAIAHYQLNDFNGCIEANTRLLELSPNNVMGYFNRGTAYGKINDFRNAIADFNKAVQIDPGYTEAYFNLGLAYYWSNDKAHACQNWAKARNLGSQKAARVLEKYCR
ncbi:MAG: tetratricopeptide repeat protein [Sphingobacteriia bacterium]|nr:tetratricopeptide repeat protein [Sphingobacteriia bacterium]